ncbi:hypothetical protein AWC38_SpisGene25333, partial [Stylophora pistillata]
MMGASLFTSPITATHLDDEDAVHFQASIRGTQESQDWTYHPNSRQFISPKGQVIEPWNQPKEIRELRQQGYGLDTLESLLASSVLRINSMSNGELTLYLLGRLRGGGGGQSTSRGGGGYNSHDYPSCRNAGPSDRFCRIAPTYTNTDYQQDRQISRETGITTVQLKGTELSETLIMGRPGTVAAAEIEQKQQAVEAPSPTLMVLRCPMIFWPLLKSTLKPLIGSI